MENERVIYRPSLTKTLPYLLFCLVFTIIGVLMISDGLVMGWLVSGVFALGGLVLLLNIWAGKSYLLLETDGFTVCGPNNSKKYLWLDIDHFATGLFPFNKLVVFRFSESYQEEQTLRKVAEGLSGYEGALPDSFGHKPEELAYILNEWRMRYAQASRPPELLSEVMAGPGQDLWQSRPESEEGINTER